MSYKFLSLTIAGCCVLGSPAIYAAEVLDSGQIRFGTGAENSVNTNGNLQQPFYFDQTANQWYQLTPDFR